MTVSAITHADATSFLAANLHWLKRHEAFNNSLISTAFMIRDGSTVFDPPFGFFSVLRENEIKGCALITNTDGLLVSEVDHSCIDSLISEVLSSNISFRRVCGEATSVDAFVNKLHLVQRPYVLERHWSVYSIDHANFPPRLAKGKIRICRVDEEDLIKEWSRQYSIESPAHLNIEQYLARKIREKALYVWDDDGPKVMAAVSAPTDNSVRIAAVFTPVVERGRGYASAIVAELVQRLLSKSYRYVTLSAIHGHHSERVYKKLGFKLIGSRLAFVAEK